MATDNHTPLNTTSNNISDSNFLQTSPNSDNNNLNNAQSAKPIAGKEREPFTIRTEAPSDEREKSMEAESPVESGESAENKNTTRIDVPNIDKIASDAGVKVAPSATPFPSIYDVKTLIPDEQIAKDIQESPLKGARWVAEIAKYVLWQARIGLKKVGNRVVRVPLSNSVGVVAKIKRIFWY